MDNYIYIERNIVDKPVFSNPKLLKVYVLLRAHATNTPIKRMIDGQWVDMEPGQLTIGTRQLAVEIGISPAQAWRYLRRLEQMNEISVTPFKNMSLITLTYFPGRSDDIERNKEEAQIERAGGYE